MAVLNQGVSFRPNADDLESPILTPNQALDEKIRELEKKGLWPKGKS